MVPEIRHKSAHNIITNYNTIIGPYYSRDKSKPRAESANTYTSTEHYFYAGNVTPSKALSITKARVRLHLIWGQGTIILFQ